MSKDASKGLIGWKPINDRLITARFNTNYGKLSIIQCYTPTNEDTDEMKEEFYNTLILLIQEVPKHDVLMVMGDLNAKVGQDNTGFENIMGKEAVGLINDNGERLIEMCITNNLVIGGSLFQHKNIHKTTWTSPSGRLHNQIDHIMINSKWRTSLQDVRAMRDQNYKEHFKLELRNHFELLEQIPIEYVNVKWEKLSSIYKHCSDKILGIRKGKRKDWMSMETWQMVEDRKIIKELLTSSEEGTKATLKGKLRLNK
ncbi:craniofacial development protein 2-like [Ostrea edulis]|uniref:craniofacial development protein 2-like n=1 Tax=Ostrea edulis TaxID=37623 RepID=UPI0024AEEBC9|nr:craniofacial development protein 2-like [Ostrea edulis]